MNELSFLLDQKYFWPLILGGLLLWAVFIWKEWPERSRLRGRIKMGVSLIGMASLVLLLLRPALPLGSREGLGILLTQGHRPKELDSLRSRYRGIAVEDYRPGRTMDVLEGVDSLFILGRGPQLYDHWQLGGRTVHFLGGEEPSGLVDISQPRELYLGEELVVRAKVMRPEAGHWILLRDPGGNALDSVALEAGPQQSIQLGARPKAKGRFIYTLEERDSLGGPLAKEPLPLIVREREALDILMVNRFPTFEAKYLKNFLAQRGHGLLVRSQMSRGKYKFEYINRKGSPLHGLSAENLRPFDLIVMDAPSYLGLGASSKTALETALRENGSGLLLLPDAELFRAAAGRTPFRFDPDPDTSVPLEGTTAPLEKYPFAFRGSFALQPVALGGEPLAAYRPMERGRIATSLLKDSYGLQLRGEGESYAALWTELLDAVVPRGEAGAQWLALTPLPRVDAPFEFQLRGPMEDPSVQTAEGAQIPLIRDFLDPNQWRGTQYPKKAGWNHLELPGDSLPGFDYYVFGPDQRRAMGAMELLGANRATLEGDKGFSLLGEPKRGEVVPLSPYWFFIPFLLCMGWLWLEPRLRD